MACLAGQGTATKRVYGILFSETLLSYGDDYSESKLSIRGGEGGGGGSTVQQSSRGASLQYFSGVPQTEWKRFVWVPSRCTPSGNFKAWVTLTLPGSPVYEKKKRKLERFSARLRQVKVILKASYCHKQKENQSEQKMNFKLRLTLHNDLNSLVVSTQCVHRSACVVSTTAATCDSLCIDKLITRRNRAHDQVAFENFYSGYRRSDARACKLPWVGDVYTDHWRNSNSWRPWKKKVKTREEIEREREREREHIKKKSEWVYMCKSLWVS